MPPSTKVGLNARVEGCGAQPITWLGMAGELQRDWARTEPLGEVAQIFIDHAGASGSALLWEMQLLGACANAANTTREGQTDEIGQRAT